MRLGSVRLVGMRPWLVLALVALFVCLLAVVGNTPQPQAMIAPLSPVPSANASPAPVHGRKGVYLTAYAAAKPGLFDETLVKLRQVGLNAVVVDVKNNHGEVCYATGVEQAHRLGAVKPILDLPALVEKAHRAGVYLIARQVVFYDPFLAKYLGSAADPWVWPTVEAACAYNLDLAAEVERLGVDEIQFDYIRFPDDGPIGPDYTERCRAVTEFVRRARARLSIPVSVDVYGRVMFPWNARRIDPIGQCLEDLAPHVDAVSPMLYPSHYVEARYKNDPYGTVREALEHGQARVDVPLRPYLQAFAMAIPPGLSLEDYILAQVRAAEERHADGYLFWNPTSDYAALWQALARRM